MAVTRPSQRLWEIIQPSVFSGRLAAAVGTQVAKNVLHSRREHLSGSGTAANCTNGPVGDVDRPKVMVRPHQSSSLSTATNEAPDLSMQDRTVNWSNWPLYLDEDDQGRAVWNTDKPWQGADVCAAVAELLDELGLTPPGAGEPLDHHPPKEES